ncbi:hypothetical protein V8E55_011808 [Tylopilus felleus]
MVVGLTVAATWGDGTHIVIVVSLVSLTVLGHQHHRGGGSIITVLVSSFSFGGTSGSGGMGVMVFSSLLHQCCHHLFGRPYSACGRKISEIDALHDWFGCEIDVGVLGGGSGGSERTGGVMEIVWAKGARTGITGWDNVGA